MAPNAPARFAKMAYANVLAVQPAIAHARQTVRIAIAAKKKFCFSLITIGDLQSYVQK